MSKMVEVVKKLIEDDNTVSLVLPGLGVAKGKVEKLDDDVVTVKPSGKPRMVMHISQFAVQRD